MIIVLYFLEREFAKLERNDINLTSIFLNHFKYANPFKKALLINSVNYQENGVLPYSSYLYKKFMEKDFYYSALNLNLALFFLKKETDSEMIDFSKN
jgi:hypothetical protein